MTEQLSFTSPITELRGAGDKTASLFASEGISNVGELLHYYPMGYDDFGAPVTVDRLTPGSVQAVTLTVTGNAGTAFAGGYRITNFRAADAAGELRITYYNMPYLSRTIRPGSVHVFRGMVRRHQNGHLQLDQPSIYSPADYEKLSGTLQPRYPQGKKLGNKLMIRLMRQALAGIRLPADYLPEEDRVRLALMKEEEALRGIHFPHSREELAAARNRLVFDEFFAFILSIRRQRCSEETLVNERPMIPVAQTERLIERLPYELTGSQKEAWAQIQEDLCGPHVMNRLLQGDVGSGKTILAFLSLLLCAANGRQGAMMVPTEVLARQHMKDLLELTRSCGLPLRPVLLTGAVTGKSRREACAGIGDGSFNVVIGTHALIQDSVSYHDLGLVITDEQHRFGVRQREALAGKGARVPVLVMSATPIPRTLSIILYGDLSVTRLTQMPGGRPPVKNLAAPSSDRGKMYRFILGQISQGRQAYVICPSVEESGIPGLENVAAYTENLRRSLPAAVRIESLNGRMKPAEKNRIMTAFAAHDIDILVSTTVIEVGINVPNATCMLIENAERFGLSQLHQLRGRVGRGTWQSYCMFLYSGTLREKPERLAILEKTNDGFEIAEQDLKLRGPGDLFGVRQSGEMGFRLADIYGDAELLTMTSAYVDRLQDTDRLPAGDAAGIPAIHLRSI